MLELPDWPEWAMSLMYTMGWLLLLTIISTTAFGKGDDINQK